MGVYNATVITNAGQNLIASAIAGGQAINFTAVKTSTHVYPAGTALLNLTSLSDVKQTVAPTSVDVYNNNVVQISARVPNTGIATAYLINTIGLFGSADGAETLIAVLTAQTPDEVPVFDAEAPAAFIFNIQMTIQNADEVVFEVNDTGTATVADLNRVAQPFTGATASAAGSGGRVPAPAAGDDGKFLRGDATWTAPADMVEAFTSSDVADGGATAWTGVNPLTSGETNKSIFAKLSQMFKNIRYLYKMLGTTDISSIGNGTVTGGLSSLNDSLGSYLKKSGIILGIVSAYTLEADAGRAINTEDQTGSPTLDNGFYILISETATISTSFSGRTFARFKGTGVVGINTFIPPAVSGLYYTQTIQFIYVTTGSATVSRSYYDTVATGAKHIWCIYKVIAI